jgi:hypothetical protein
MSHTATGNSSAVITPTAFRAPKLREPEIESVAVLW